MRVVLYLFLVMAGLSGCVTRNSGSRELFSAYKDSMVYTRLDTSCLHYNRGAQLRGSSRLKEISFSSPDSSGKQHVERVVYATEEWGVRDSAEVFSEGKATTDKLHINTVMSLKKAITKYEPGHVVGYIIVLFLFFVPCLLYRRKQ